MFPLLQSDTLPHANIADPVAALVLGAAAPLELLIVNGEVVVERDRVVTVDEGAVAAAAQLAGPLVLLQQHQRSGDGVSVLVMSDRAEMFRSLRQSFPWFRR